MSDRPPFEKRVPSSILSEFLDDVVKVRSVRKVDRFTSNEAGAAILNILGIPARADPKGIKFLEGGMEFEDETLADLVFLLIDRRFPRGSSGPVDPEAAG
ncbi:hypothetical protein [Brevibacterium litoralis]|uniref:hypothetical protein n=1 Tax=Brevibacterium litoralis TaxID=3138935 RepID=UPI0032EB480C